LDSIGVKSLVQAQEKAKEADKGTLGAAFQAIKSEIGITLERYKKQAADAKGTEYASLFTESDKTVEKTLGETEKLAGGDERAFWQKMAELNKSNAKMLLILDNLKNESQSRISIVDSLLGQKQLDGPKMNEMQTKIDAMRAMAASGDYINALRAGSAISKELDSIKSSDNSGLLVLGVTAFAVLGGIGVYMLKQKPEPKKPRKLPSVTDKPGPDALQKPI
jgi:hypothetical protein